MQVTQTKSEGLRREYSVVVAAAALEAKTTEKLESVRKGFQMKGFRKGKVPLLLLMKMFGKSVLGEVVQETVEKTVADHLSESGHRPAQQPDINIVNEEFNEGDDLTVEFHYECLPDVPELDFSTIKLERKIVTVEQSSIDEALGKLAEDSTDYKARGKTAKAKDADQIVIDFIGTIDGEPFEGGTVEDYPLVLGSNSFIPGFEEQLVGTRTGDALEVKVTFPAEYGAANLAGNDAVFECTVKEVRAPKPADIDDDLAIRYGTENLDQFKEQIRERIGAEFTDAGRALIKRRLLDALDGMVSFELPPSLVDAEAKSIAHQLWHEENPEVEGHDHPEIEKTDEHTSLAERRVRLGLLLAEIGTKAEIKITDQEMAQAVIAHARQYPGQERACFDFFKQNRQAMEQFRAQIFEDKVVDLILSDAEITELAISKADFEKELEALDAE